MLRFSLSLAVAGVMTFGGYSALGCVMTHPADQGLKVIATVVAHGGRCPGEAVSAFHGPGHAATLL
jgi:hypothetical protein